MEEADRMITLDLVDFELRYRDSVRMVVCPRCHAKKGQICTQPPGVYRGVGKLSRWRDDRSHVPRTRRLFVALTTSDWSLKRRLTRGEPGA